MTTTITRATCRILQSEVETMLKGIAAKHGLTLTVAGGTFDAGRFSPKVEFKVEGSDLTTWNQYAALFDLPQDAVGRWITVGQDRYTVLGINLSARRFPVNARRADGRIYRLPAATVRAALSHAEGAVSA